MGHDISAYLGHSVPSEPHMAASADELSEEIAYLRGHYGLYDALDAQMYNGGVSGGGIGRWFNRDQLQLAIRRLYALEAWHRREDKHYKVSPAIRFLQRCFKRMPEKDEWMYIDFG